MDLELTDDQELFRETTARFIESECPIPKVRELVEHPTGTEPDYLKQAAELGWFALFVPEEHGGGSVSGSPVLDAAVVAEERGRLVQPGPFVPANVAAFAVARSGTPEQQAELLPGLAAGEDLATWALAGVTGDWEPGAGLTATPSGDGYVLSGAKGLVQDAHLATWLLVTAAQDGGVTQFVVPAGTAGLTVEPREFLDVTQRVAELRFDDVRVPASAVLGTPGAAAEDVTHQLDLAVVLVVAESVGAMDRLLEFTVEYAKERTAFGRPIGSFQALKHMLANLSLSAEGSTAASVAATRALAAGRDASETASIAKAFSGDAAIDIAQGCFQVHGGIGYTWESDLHLYLRRLTTNAAVYGDAVWHRERICSIHGL